MKRIVFHITHRGPPNDKGYWQCLERGDSDPLFESRKKKNVVTLASRYLRNLYYAGPENCEVSRLREHHVPGQLSELIIHLASGRIPQGSHGRRSYGADPRRSKG